MSPRPKKTIRDLDVSGKRVLVRVDFNVPMRGGRVVDDTRIRETLPTINYLLFKGAKVILMSHLGRPDGKVVEEFKLDSVAIRASELLNCSVKKLEDCVGPAVEERAMNMRRGEVLLLENLRFHSGEEGDEPGFAARLAKLGEIYVNDAFGAAHRAHASTAGVARHLPAVAGFLMEKELEVLGRLLDDPKRSFYALLGGAKVSDKLPVITNLLGKVNGILIGGAMAFTFIAARGGKVGKSKHEPELFGKVKEIMAEAARLNVEILLPKDALAAEKPLPAQKVVTVEADRIPGGLMGLDIGPVTCQLYRNLLLTSGTIFWNGPMGVFEVKPFDSGTVAMAQTLAEAEAETVVGGGDVVAAVHQAGVADKITHISTGGGASLEFLEGRDLPGVAALLDKAASVR